MKWLSQNLAQLTDALTAWFVRKDQSIVLKAEKFLRFNGGTSFPTGVSEGAVYYRTDTNTLYVYDGSSWQAIGGSGGGTPAPHGSTHVGSGSDPVPDVTTSVAGLMSAADKTKLDGIESGATAEQTITAGTGLTGGGTGDVALNVDQAYGFVWTAQHQFAPGSAQAPFTLNANAQGQLVTGLNADLLDGNHASAFALTSDLHAQSHVLATTSALGPDHTVSGLTAGQYLRATGATTAAFQTIPIGDLPSGILLADGSVPLTAGWDAGGFRIRAETLHADVATGTPPLIIASTTVVTNLNADLLDGSHASAFATAGHNHDHGALTGLGDDDHGAVYPGLAQSETITGAWTFSTRLDVHNYATGARSTAIEFYPGDTGGVANYGIGMGPVSTEGYLEYNSGTASSGSFGHRFWVNGVERLEINGAGVISVTGNIAVTGTVDGVDVANHNARHERGGADEIDGDHLDIDWNPTNYTPSTTPSEAASVDDLTAHLYGIDQALVDPDIVALSHVTLIAGEVSIGGTTYGDGGGDFYYLNTAYPSGSGTWRVTLKSDSPATAYAELYDTTSSSQVAEVSTTTSASYVHLSASVTLTTGHHYRVRLKSSGVAQYSHCLGSYIKW